MPTALDERHVVFGALGADRTPAAAAIVYQTGGGSGTWLHLVVVVESPNGLRCLYAHALGDRAEVKDLSIVDGRVHIEAAVHSPDDAMCCPSGSFTASGYIEEDRFVLRSEPTATARAVAPAQAPVIGAWACGELCDMQLRYAINQHYLTEHFPGLAGNPCAQVPELVGAYRTTSEGPCAEACQAWSDSRAAMAQRLREAGCALPAPAGVRRSREHCVWRIVNPSHSQNGLDYVMASIDEGTFWNAMGASVALQNGNSVPWNALTNSGRLFRLSVGTEVTEVREGSLDPLNANLVRCFLLSNAVQGENDSGCVTVREVEKVCH